MLLPPWLRPVPSSYPLDRTDLRPGEWDVDTVIAEARAAGWWVTKRMVWAWIRLGWLPPPLLGPDEVASNLRQKN